MFGRGRPTETAVYALGKHTVRVKAVDSTGAESPLAAIVFFVMDSNGSGGMMLTGPDSTIMENGIDGATITQYTFTVPPVSGHSGQDYGRVRGYNIKTGAWDQLDYGTHEQWHFLYQSTDRRHLFQAGNVLLYQSFMHV